MRFERESNDLEVELGLRKANQEQTRDVIGVRGVRVGSQRTK